MAFDQSTVMVVSMNATLRVLALDLLGGHPVLDFINTLDWRGRDPAAGGATECLDSYDALLAWAKRLAVIEAGEARALAQAARQDPAGAAAMAQAARELREAIHALIAAAHVKQKPQPADLACLNRWLDAAPARLAAKSGGYVWSAGSGAGGLGLPLSRLAHLAAELLTADQLRRVACCAGPGCGWLFLDTSPNRRRRWCSMESCGNRAKAKRHYRRVKGQD